MNDFGSDAFESVLFVVRECFVYRIPPRKATAGYKAAEWGDMEAFLWKGRLRIIEKGQDCFIRLEDKDSGEPCRGKDGIPFRLTLPSTLQGISLRCARTTSQDSRSSQSSTLPGTLCSESRMKALMAVPKRGLLLAWE